MFFSLSNLLNISKDISDKSKPRFSKQAVLHYWEAWLRCMVWTKPMRNSGRSSRMTCQIPRTDSVATTWLPWLKHVARGSRQSPGRSLPFTSPVSCQKQGIKPSASLVSSMNISIYIALGLNGLSVESKFINKVMCENRKGKRKIQTKQLRFLRLRISHFVMTTLLNLHWF